MRLSKHRIGHLALSLLAFGVAIFTCSTGAVVASAAHVDRVVSPSATTTQLHAVEGSSALLEGVINPHGHYTVWRFQWGDSSDYGHLAYKYAPEEGWSDESRHVVAEPIECLSPHTVYHYRVIAYSHGVRAFGRDKTFRTPGLRYGRAAAYKFCPGHAPIG